MSDNEKKMPAKEKRLTDEDQAEPIAGAEQEIGGPKGPEPTRFGDWEVAGRCSDF